MANKNLCIFGEVLFDHFPDGKRVLGGAPFNVAWHLQAFTQNPQFVSRVGKDAEGEEIKQSMQQWGMDTRQLQTDPKRPTGQVKVTFADNEPEYNIVENCAYDAIDYLSNESTLSIEDSLQSQCHLLYHGSLALRNKISADALQQLKQRQPEIIFMDVNLRSPWWNKEQLKTRVKEANWVKLNHHELEILGSNDSPTINDFLHDFELSGLIVTHGSKGAEILTCEGEHHFVEPETSTQVVDTVGAGDAFASIIILGLLNHWPLDLTLHRAQSFASQIVGKRGATVSDKGFYQQFISAWSI